MTASNRQLMFWALGAVALLAITTDFVRLRDASEISMVAEHGRLVLTLALAPARLRQSSHAFVSLNWPRLIATASFVTAYTVYLIWYLTKRRTTSEAPSFWRALRPTLPVLLLAAACSPSSTDTLHYLHYGSMILARQNPYDHLPATLHTPSSTFIVWPQTSPYGPVALAVYAIVAAICRGNLLIGVATFKVLFFALHVATARLCWSVDSRGRTARTLAYLLNPLLVMSQLVDVHMDALVIFLLVAAFCLLEKGRGLFALGLVVTACLAKAVIVLLLPFLVLWFWVSRDFRSLGLGVAGIGLVVAGLTLTIFPTLSKWKSLTYLLPNIGRSISQIIMKIGEWTELDVSTTVHLYRGIEVLGVTGASVALWFRRFRGRTYDAFEVSRD